MIFLSLYLLLGITWVFYLAMMHLKHNKEKITLPVKIIMTPIILLFVVIYILMNLIFGSIIFLELPRSLQFTSRCQRNIAKRDGSWRFHLAVWFCKHLLDPYDEGHCQ